MFIVSVTPDGGESYDVTAVARDVLKWERSGKDRSVVKFESNPTLSDVYEIAWIAAKRLGVFSESQDKFEETCDVGNVRPSAAGNPTRKGR